MKRIVVGYDGSDCADTAVELAGTLAADAGAPVVLVTVVPDIRAIRSAWGALVLGPPDVIDRELAGQAHAMLEAPIARLTAVGVQCEPVVARGRAPQGIAEEATRVGADLVVVGARGLGPITSTLLGSVSQEVADLATRPVLVARTPHISGIVLGSDGSRCAEAAERFLEGLPSVRSVPVNVVSVAEVLRPLATGVAPTVYSQAMAAQAEYEREAKREHQRIAEDTAARLRTAGFDAVASARTGDPAGELLSAASDAPADLIVVGSRGLTGLKRLVLGSVARRLVQHAQASVLIVRTLDGQGA